MTPAEERDLLELVGRKVLAKILVAWIVKTSPVLVVALARSRGTDVSETIRFLEALAELDAAAAGR